MVNPNRFYTYAYLREDKTPYYIGKGTGNRAYAKRYGNGRARRPKNLNNIILLKRNLSEEEAFRHEIYMIAVFGRKDLGTGILHNRTDGGEGSSGCIPSEETRRKIGETSKGRTLSEEHKRKLIEANKGKTHSEKSKRKMSKAHKNPSEETKRKMSEAKKGKTPWNKGKNHSEESIRKISEATKGRKWWNDGCGNYKRMIECPGNGWRLGRK
jgi:hypothetical protein